MWQALRNVFEMGGKRRTINVQFLNGKVKAKAFSKPSGKK